MVIDRKTPCQLIEIRHPRYHDRKVLIAKYKVGTLNKIIFTEAKSMPGEYAMKGEDIEKCPVGTNGKLAVYCVPIDSLEPLEYKK